MRGRDERRAADGFSVQPTTKLDGFTAVYSEFLLTAGNHIPNDGKKVAGGIEEVQIKHHGWQWLRCGGRGIGLRPLFNPPLPALVGFHIHGGGLGRP